MRKRTTLAEIANLVAGLVSLVLLLPSGLGAVYALMNFGMMGGTGTAVEVFAGFAALATCSVSVTYFFNKIGS